MQRESWGGLVTWGCVWMSWSAWDLNSKWELTVGLGSTRIILEMQLPRTEALGNKLLLYCWELVENLVTAFEKWHCHYNSEKAGVSLESSNWGSCKWPPFFFCPISETQKQRSLVLDFFFFSPWNCKEKRMWSHIQCDSICVQFLRSILPASVEWLGEGAWHWHSNERIKYLSGLQNFFIWYCHNKRLRGVCLYHSGPFIFWLLNEGTSGLRHFFEKEQSIIRALKLQSEYFLLG